MEKENHWIPRENVPLAQWLDAQQKIQPYIQAVLGDQTSSDLSYAVRLAITYNQAKLEVREFRHTGVPPKLPSFTLVETLLLSASAANLK